MWETLLAQGFWQGELWNKRKNGEIYAESFFGPLQPFVMEKEKQHISLQILMTLQPIK